MNMEPIYIVFACSGGVLLILLIAYLLVSIESWKKNVQMKKDLHKLYGDSKLLSKAEYDFAFYDNVLHGGGSKAQEAKQVTIDEFVSGETENADSDDELSRFKPMEEVRESVIVGHYNPESISN